MIDVLDVISSKSIIIYLVGLPNIINWEIREIVI